MSKKIAIIGAVILLIIPFQSVIGLNQDIYTTNDNQIIIQNTDLDVISMINKINYSILFGYLEKIVSFGVRHVGSENCRNAAEYINEEFQQLGLESCIDSWKYPKYKCQNVIATYNGTDPTSDAVFVLTAHLDTIGNSVGANDDGSGVAALLTIANIFSNYNFNHTVKFVIVSGHEVGTYGSFDYAKKAYFRDENIIAHINVDMVGNSTCGNIIQAWTPERSYRLYYFTEEISYKYEKYIDIEVQLTAHYPMDSQSFVDYGYDAISFIQPKVFDYPIHTPEDSLDKINYPYFENVTKLVIALTAEFANKPIDVQVRFVTPKEGHAYLFNRPILKLLGLNLHRSRIRGITYLIGRTIAKINITTEEEIITVSYSIDGNTDYYAIFTESPYDWKIQKPIMSNFRLIGKHKLGVHVCTSTGKTAYDEMDFYALTPI
ncbi:MAG: M28 family peptidase [Thermoplasmatales archaeon]|nr:M28 family peptidase [Thermoplasmatales archaeon]